jgi:hypothetical protein
MLKQVQRDEVKSYLRYPTGSWVHMPLAAPNERNSSFGWNEE